MTSKRFNVASPLPGDACYDRVSLCVIVVLSVTPTDRILTDGRPASDAFVVDQLGRMPCHIIVSERLGEAVVDHMSDWRALC